jgi:tetratricopeptide (TPR) repeat protein
VATLEPLLAALRDQPPGAAYTRVAVALADSLEESGDRSRAVRVLEDARSRAPNDAGLLQALAGAYFRDKQTAAAERAYRELLANNPANSLALNGLSYLLAEQKERLGEAVELVQRALAIEPDNPSYLDTLGWTYVQQGKAEQGRAVLERAAKALPNDSVVWHHFAESLFQLKRYREAMTAWDKALAGDRDGIDVGEVTRRRDRAKELAGGL